MNHAITLYAVIPTTTETTVFFFLLQVLGKARYNRYVNPAIINDNMVNLNDIDEIVQLLNLISYYKRNEAVRRILRGRSWNQ